MVNFSKNKRLPTLDEFLNEREEIRSLNQYDLLVKNIFESNFLSESETFIRFILEKLSDFLKKAWDYMKGKARDSVNGIKDQLTEKVKSANIDPKQFKTEVQQFKDMARTSMTYF